MAGRKAIIPQILEELYPEADKTLMILAIYRKAGANTTKTAEVLRQKSGRPVSQSAVWQYIRAIITGNNEADSK